MAYKFDIFASQLMSRAYIYVGATDEKNLMSDAIIKHTISCYVLKKEIDTDKITAKIKDTNLKNTISNILLTVFSR